MANTLSIVEDSDFTDLPKSVRENAVAETKKLFAFIPKFVVATRQPVQFPATLDFTDSIVKIVGTDDEVTSVMNQSIRQQMLNIRQSIRQHRIQFTGGVPDRFPATPERGGVGFQQKEILTVVTDGRITDRLVMTMTGGVASLETVKSSVVEWFADGRTEQEIQEQQKKAISKQGLERYFATYQSLKDTRDLVEWELMAKGLADWPKDHQDAVGIVLGRLIAHEARHQYVLPHFNGGGLGADAAVLFGDKNFEQFDKQDQSEIFLRINVLRRTQQTGTIHLETLPKGQPFPF